MMYVLALRKKKIQKGSNLIEQFIDFMFKTIKIQIFFFQMI